MIDNKTEVMKRESVNFSTESLSTVAIVVVVPHPFARRIVFVCHVRSFCTF